ncbi:MAG: cold-shock protein [Alphaproteobacteria bacterium]|jgi:CspA family cold shock protein|nr:cold-shock protein [Alphaproteobacteria bacterium]MCV6599273.1 cold-shock protein [Alphaproteobacteria bacterium]
MAKGKVKWFNSTKGYGFIETKDSAKDVFIHISALQKAGMRTLDEGQDIEFDIVESKGRESAENIKA